MYKNRTLLGFTELRVLDLFLDLRRHYFAEVTKKTGLTRPRTLRTLRKLAGQSILETRKEANVKYYSLKNNPLARSVLALAEYNRTEGFFDKRKTLRRAISMIEEKQPDILISIIFGSQVKGYATKSSDFDLLLVKEQHSKEGIKRIEDLIDLVNGRTGLKISPHLMTLEEFWARNDLVDEIIEQHILIGGAELFFRAVLP